MRYFNRNMQEKLRGQFVEICSLSEVTPNKAKWTHYAQIIPADNAEWEVSRRFMGDNEDEMWIYGTFKRFSNAVKFVSSGRINNAIPIAKY